MIHREAGALAAAALAAAALHPSAARGAEDCAAVLARVRGVTALLERMEAADAAVARCPADGAVAYERAFALERLRRYPEALAAYRGAAALAPSNGKAHVGIADTLMQLGDPAGAVDSYERGLQLDERNDRARKALELARIKARAQRGEDISAADFVRVMTEADRKGSTATSAEGPLVRLQVHFRQGATALDEAAVERLRAVGEALRTPALAAARLEIAGHTDDAGKPEANLALSRARAEAVRDHLVSRYGLGPERLPVVGYGQGQPLAPNTTAENRRMNRRVEFRLLR